MVRKAKSATVKKIEKYFISTNKPEIAFSEISESVGIGTNKLVGTLTSNPSLFEKTKTQRKSELRRPSILKEGNQTARKSKRKSILKNVSR